jgi:hypothetical protein
MVRNIVFFSSHSLTFFTLVLAKVGILTTNWVVVGGVDFVTTYNIPQIFYFEY